MSNYSPYPASMNEKLDKEKAHAQNMLSLIAGLSGYNVAPLKKYDYGAQAGEYNKEAQDNYITNLMYNNDPYTQSIWRRLGRQP